VAAGLKATEQDMMIRIVGIVFTAFCLMAVVGCSQYVDGYDYAPRPALAQIPATQPNEPAPVTANVYVAGVRYDDQDDQIPPSIEIRMSIDNTGSDTVVLNPPDLNLSNGQLLQFSPPIIRPPTSIVIGSMQSAYLTAYFPFPPGVSLDNTDLSTLRLRWRLQIGPRMVGQIVYFNRVPTVYYDPYWYAPPPPVWGYYGGVVIVHRR
jgi:hypothetical protein